MPTPDRRLRTVLLTLTTAGIVSLGILLVMSESSLDSGSDDENVASQADKSAAGSGLAGRRPSSVDAFPDAVWLHNEPSTATGGSPAQAIQQAARSVEKGESPCERAVGRWTAANGMIITLHRGGRAELAGPGDNAVSISWTCHKAGTLELSLPGGGLLLHVAKDNQLVSDYAGDGLVPLTKSPR